MALNLSRNTKVFVSSVNGANPASATANAGNIRNGKITNGGTGYAVGDIITCDTTSGSGKDAKFIVKAVSSGVVTHVAMPNNCRGKDFIVGETASQATDAVVTGANHATASSGESFVFTVSAVSTGTTIDGGRIGTGLFKGNETTANTFRLGVLDGYSFSQGSDSTDVTISEAGATPNRGSKRFNDSLPPAEWSFGTYVRPFKHGAASYRTAGTFDCVENILWAALSGTGLPDNFESGSENAAQRRASQTAAGAGVKTSSTAAVGSLCDFISSDVHELMKLTLYFALENTTYRLNEAQVGQAEIDFSIDGIAQINWSGNATTIDQIVEMSEDPSVAVEFTTSDQGSGSTILDCSVLNAASKLLANKGDNCEEFNYVDTTGPSDADYLRNKLSSLHLSTLQQGGGSDSQGLDAKEYDINITGGSVTIANNVTYVTPETIGVVDKPIGSFTGARVVSGSLNMYLDTKPNGSNQLLTDLAASSDLVSNSFDLRLFMGVSGNVTLSAGGVGEAMEADDFTAPGVEFNMPRAHLTVPTIEVADLISASVEFAANGENLLTGNELSVKYLGATTHTQAGYKATGSQAEAVT